MGRKPLLSELTLREKIGQTAVGYTHNDFSKLSNEKPWGSLYVGGNLKLDVFNMEEEVGNTPAECANFADFVENVSSHLKIPYMPALDNVMGLKNAFYELTYLNNPTSIGSADDEKLAYEAGVCRALQAKCVGARWWWGPELDFCHRNAAISHGREFSDDPDRMIRLGIAMIRGCLDNGVIPTAKHFPGDDGMDFRDPHISAQNNLLTYNDWLKGQGRIFQAVIDADVPSIMIGHQGFPAIDDSMLNGEYRPATVSYKIITELLKDKMGFRGVVVSDGLSMRSLVTALDEDMKKVYIEAFKAGNDVMLGCEDYYIELIEKAVLEGEISMDRVDDACQRVLDMKEKAGLFEDGFKQSIRNIDEVNKYCKEINRKISEKGLSLVCDKQKLLPVHKDNIKKVAIVANCPKEQIYNTLSAMKASFEKRGAIVSMVRSLKSREQSQQIGREHDLIVYVGHFDRNSTFADPEYTSFYYTLLEGKEKSVGIGICHPNIYYNFYYNFPTFINAYCYNDEMQEAVVAAIYGEIPFQGGEPFALIPKEITAYLRNGVK